MPYSQILPTLIPGLFVLEPKIFGDERGWYSPTFEAFEFKTATGVDFKIIQEGESFNAQKGILRGLHYQVHNTQGKIVRVLKGSVYDVAVDIRHDSPSFGKSVGIELTSKNHLQLWVPPGFAHGYLALEPNTWFTYLITDGIYDKLSERGINPFDPELDVKWPMDKSEISCLPRDLDWPRLKDIKTDELL